MNTVNRAVALRIKELLKEKGITLYRLAMNSGLTHSTLKILCMKLSITIFFLPSFSSLAALIRLLVNFLIVHCS